MREGTRLTGLPLKSGASAEVRRVSLRRAETIAILEQTSVSSGQQKPNRALGPHMGKHRKGPKAPKGARGPAQDPAEPRFWPRVQMVQRGVQIVALQKVLQALLLRVKCVVFFGGDPPLLGGLAGFGTQNKQGGSVFRKPLKRNYPCIFALLSTKSSRMLCFIFGEPCDNMSKETRA